MGQAKVRKAEIEALKSKPKSKGYSLLKFMNDLGDGDWAEHQRNAVISQIMTTMGENMLSIVSNFMAGKTTLAQGIQVGFDRNDMTTIDDYHVSVEHPNFIQVMSEFQSQVAKNSNKKLLQPAVMYCGDLNSIAPAFGYEYNGCMLAITEWKHGTIIRFMPSNTIAKHDATGDATIDAKHITETITKMKAGSY